MNDLTTGSSTWEAFCSYITHLAAKDANIVLVENDDRLYATFKTIIDGKQLFHSSTSSANMILNAAGFALNGKKHW